MLHTELQQPQEGYLPHTELHRLQGKSAAGHSRTKETSKSDRRSTPKPGTKDYWPYNKLQRPQGKHAAGDRRITKARKSELQKPQGKSAERDCRSTKVGESDRVPTSKFGTESYLPYTELHRSQGKSVAGDWRIVDASKSDRRSAPKPGAEDYLLYNKLHRPQGKPTARDRDCAGENQLNYTKRHRTQSTRRSPKQEQHKGRTLEDSVHPWSNRRDPLDPPPHRSSPPQRQRPRSARRSLRLQLRDQDCGDPVRATAMADAAFLACFGAEEAMDTETPSQSLQKLLATKGKEKSGGKRPRDRGKGDTSDPAPNSDPIQAIPRSLWLGFEAMELLAAENG